MVYSQRVRVLYAVVMMRCRRQNYVHDDVNPVITTEDYRLVPSGAELRGGMARFSALKAIT